MVSFFLDGRRVLTKSDGQTEDGHAMMTLDTSHSLQNLSPAVRGWEAYVCGSQETSREVRSCL